MARIEVSREINAPADVIYDYMDDHRNTAEYLHGMSNFTWDTPYHVPGTRLNADSKSAGMTIHMVLETTEAERGRKMAGIFAEGIKGTWEYLFAPTEKGTKVTAVIDYDLPMGILGQITDRVLVERENQANMEKTLATIKEKSEALRMRVEKQEPSA